MENVKKIVSSVRDAMVVSLSSAVDAALSDANMAIANEPASKRSQDLSLKAERDAILERFALNIRANFDELTGVVDKQVNVLDYGSLSLVEEADLEAIIAMEGMICHARNCDISEYLSFTTRLDSLFFGTRIDESNNPMDPEQLGEAFKESLMPVKMTALELLVCYRKFNQNVFHKLEEILTEANSVLIENQVLPKLDMAARSRREQQNKRSARPAKVDPIDRAFERGAAGDASKPHDQQLLSIMQKLLHSISDSEGGREPQRGHTSVPASISGSGQAGMMVGNQRVELVADEQLFELLNKLQPSVPAGGGDQTQATKPLNLNESVGSLLEQEGGAETLRAIDRKSSDIINLVTILFEEIWSDRTVPLPIKELVGRTQITILKIALVDPSFFDSSSHPARVFLNEIATAGISWTGSEQLDQNPVYMRMQELVRHVVRDFDGDISVVEEYLAEFVEFREEHAASEKEKEQKLLDEDERVNRLDEIEQYAHAKIEERILDDAIDPFVKDFLLSHFHKFVVQVVLSEGPGGASWRPIMNTIDVLLWTVNADKLEGDLQRFGKVNPRLLQNLGKALDVAGVDKAEADEAITQLKRVQNACFERSATPRQSAQEEAGESPPDADAEKQAASKPKLPKDDEHLKEVANYPIGIWLEFQVSGGHSIRCTLAAKIDTIEKYVFVNAQGVKVVEKSRMGLARELKAGTVKVICGAPLVDRAMESVIARLRTAQAEQGG